MHGQREVDLDDVFWVCWRHVEGCEILYTMFFISTLIAAFIMSFVVWCRFKLSYDDVAGFCFSYLVRSACYKYNKRESLKHGRSSTWTVGSIVDKSCVGWHEQFLCHCLLCNVPVTPWSFPSPTGTLIKCSLTLEVGTSHLLSHFYPPKN